MIHLKIGNIKAELKTSWDEMTVRDAIGLVSIPAPEGYIDYLKGGDPVLATPKYMQDCLQALLSRQIEGRINQIDLKMYFETVVLPLLKDVVTLQPETVRPGYLKHFDMDGQRYYFPEPLVINNGLIPAVKETAASVSEGMDLLRSLFELEERGVTYFPALLATYCRKEGERYSEALQLDRAELFMDAPMMACWEVFFWLCKSTDTLTRDFISRSQREMRRLRRQLRLQAWRRWATEAVSTVWRRLALQGR